MGVVEVLTPTKTMPAMKLTQEITLVDSTLDRTTIGLMTANSHKLLLQILEKLFLSREPSTKLLLMPILMTTAQPRDSSTKCIQMDTKLLVSSMMIHSSHKLGQNMATLDLHWVLSK